MQPCNNAGPQGDTSTFATAITETAKALNITFEDVQEAIRKLLMAGDELNFHLRKQQLEFYYDARKDLCPSDE